MSKHEKQWSKYKLMFNLYILITMLLVSVFYFLPKFNEIQSNKSELNKKYEEYIKLKNDWYSFSEFKSKYNNKKFVDTVIWLTSSEIDNIKEKQWDTYVSWIIKSSKEDFYKGVFNNDSKDEYLDFLDNLQKDIYSWDSISKKEDSEKIISRNLPIYVSNIKTSSISDDEVKFDDASFIEYIDSIIKTFNLTLSSWISINKLEEVKWFSSWNNEKWTSSWDNLSSWIYSFNVDLDLTWEKSKIFDFISFIQNVWNINFIDNEIIPYENLSNYDSIYSWKKEENIYLNPMIEIVSIYFNKYPDNYYLKFKKQYESLLNFINSTTPRESYSVKVTLKFYVRWLPDHKKEETILSYNTKYRDLLQKYKQLLSEVNNREFKQKGWNSVWIIKEVQDTFSYIESKSKDISAVMWKYNKWDIDWAYNYFIDMKYIFDKLDTTYEDLNQKQKIIKQK